METLPDEVLVQCLHRLDYISLCRMAQVSRRLYTLASDASVWQQIMSTTLDKVRSRDEDVDMVSSTSRSASWRTSAGISDHESSCRRTVRERVEAIREFLQFGTTDFTARTLRRHFSELNSKNALLLSRLLQQSVLDIDDVCVDMRGHAFSRKSMPRLGRDLARLREQGHFFPESAETLDQYLLRHNDRLVVDPRSEIYLVRMLLSRLHNRKASPRHLREFLTVAHLIVYDSISYPILYYPPRNPVSTTSRRFLRSAAINTNAPQVNWGVVETIYSMFSLYRDLMPENIPGFVPSRQWIEGEVPMTASMFNADITGNWHGLYGYLDFRELEVLDDWRPLTPDYFDGCQNVRFRQEEPIPKSSPDEPQRWQFSGDGHSPHGPFHIHGTTVAMDGFEERGWKVISFDEMFNSDGLMPWVMEGVVIPSIGIIGRWRDNSEPQGEGVEGGYVLWRDRARDAISQLRRLAWEADLERTGTLSHQPRPSLPVRTAGKEAGTETSYIVIEEATQHGQDFSWCPAELEPGVHG
ncbi:F-box protein of unknown function [Savitreella phatthalungensis]